jgi:hypothetical protein
MDWIETAQDRIKKWVFVDTVYFWVKTHHTGLVIINNMRSEVLTMMNIRITVF